MQETFFRSPQMNLLEGSRHLAWSMYLIIKFIALGLLVMIVIRQTNFYMCFKRLLCLALLLSVMIFLFHPGRFAVSYDFIDRSDMFKYLVTAPLPDNSTKPLCPIFPNIKFRSDTGDLLDLKFNKSEIVMGGRWTPSNCSAQFKIALIVPYRNREEHLSTFVKYMHGFLQAQSIEYSLYVVQQSPKLAFNRGLLFNIGYSQALQDEQIPCFIFHDVDLLPESLENIYACTSVPRHMSSSVNTFRYKLPYGTLFGGVVAMLQAHFQMVNGFPNRYFGWGGEDDDLFMRVINKGMNVVRFDPEITRYYMLPHIKELAPPENAEHLQHVSVYQDRDGLNDYKRYCVTIESKPMPLYMLIYVDLQLPPEFGRLEPLK